MRTEQPGVTAFTELSDVPNSYSTFGGDVLTVKLTEDGIEFLPGGTGGGVSSVVAGTGIAVDNTDPANPIVSTTGSPGSFSVTETEVDFGTLPVVEKTFTVVDALISGTSKIMVTESGSIGTGRIASGDALWDTISYSCVAAAGSFTLYARASGSIVGYRKLYYTYS